MKYLIFIVSTLALAAFVKGHNETYNGDCHFVTNHCNRDAGLYCNEENKCVCNELSFDAVHNFDVKHNYTLVWDESEKKCVGKLGSICIGTGNHPAARLSQPCEATLVCVQLEGYPDSVGQCKVTDVNDLGNSLTSSSQFVTCLILLTTLFKLYYY